jgi:hypothetical protein
MPQTIDRGGVRKSTSPVLPPRGRCGPVLLATFAGTPPHADATRIAVEAAFETGATLLLADVVKRARRPWLRRRAVHASPAHANDAAPVPAATPAPALSPALCAAADHAAEFAVRVERMRVAAPRPVAGLLAAVAEYRPGLVVFASDPGALGRWRWRRRRRYRAFVIALAREAPCLLWTAAEPHAQLSSEGAASAQPSAS